MSKKVEELATKENNRCVMVSAQVEAELASLDGDDRTEFLEALGVNEVPCPITITNTIIIDKNNVLCVFLSFWLIRMRWA